MWELSKQRWYHTAISWVFYQIGDKISLIGVNLPDWWILRPIHTVIWFIYQKTMAASGLLDPDGKVWQTVEENSNGIES